jgi:signal transduction histidine kinase
VVRAGAGAECEAVLAAAADDAARLGTLETRLVEGILRGAALGAQGRVVESLELLAATAADAAHSPRIALAAERELARTLIVAGRAAEALEVAGRGIALARAEGVPEIEVMLLITVAMVHAYADEPEPYAAYMERALAIARSLNDRRLIAHCNINLGGAYARARRDADAQRAYDEAGELARAIDWTEGEALVLSGLGGLHCEQGRLESGEIAFLASNVILTRLGQMHQVGRQLEQLGVLCNENGRPERAVEHLEAAIRVGQAHGFEGVVWLSARTLAQVLRGLGRFQEACDALTLSVELREAEQQRRTETRLQELRLEHRLDLERAEAEHARARATALAASNEALRAVLDALPEAIFVQGPRGPLWSNAVARALSPEADTPAGVGLLALKLPTEARRRLAYDAARTAGTDAFEVALALVGGDRRDVEIRFCALDFEGQPAVVYMLHDLTERKRMAARVEHLDRVAALGTLVSGIAHEVNNPLAYVVANVDFALMALRDPDTGHADVLDALREAADGATRVRAVIQAMRAFAAPRETSAGPVELVAVLSDAAELVRGTVTGRQVIEIALPSERIEVEGDRASLVQTFANLLHAAVGSTAEPGAPRPEIRVQVVARALERIEIRIGDDGPAIDPERRRRLFDPFQKGRTVPNGAGLELATAARYIHLVGGRIDVHSAEGEGTLITVQLLRSSTPPGIPA